MEKGVCETTQFTMDRNMTARVLAIREKNKAGYTANKQSLTGGQEQFADGQGQSFSGQGLYFGWAGAVMLRNHKFGQFRVVQNFL